MVRQQVPKRSPPLESPPQHGQADYPSDDADTPDLVEYVQNPGSESISSAGDSMEAELGGTASESMGTTTDSMYVEPRRSLLDTTSSSEEMPAAAHRRSPILFTSMPGVRCPVPARVLQPRSPILFTSRPGVRWLPPSEPEDQGQNPDTTDSLESDSDVSIKTEGYAADIESANEVEYTAEPELYQEEILAICAAQRELNGNARLALFRMPPKKCGICPICKIGMPQNK